MSKTHKTIRQLLDGKVIHEPGNNGYKKIVLFLLEMGFTDDFVPSYNMLTFGPSVIDQIDLDSSIPAHHDLRWLCNKLSSIHQEYLGEINRSRLKRVVGPSYDQYNRKESYWHQTKIWINPKTGRTYVFEFDRYS